jgi:hypothetical protein
LWVVVALAVLVTNLATVLELLEVAHLSTARLLEVEAPVVVVCVVVLLVELVVHQTGRRRLHTAHLATQMV